MADIRRITVPGGTTYEIKDYSAISSVTYSGHTVTVTGRDGSVTTFDTADTTYTPASTNPVMDGTAAVGTSEAYARADHVHPGNTAKANLASPTFTGTPKAPTAAAGTNTTQIATTAFVMNAFQANDAMVFKGTIGSSGATVTSLPGTHYQGWTYRVITAGSYAGQTCEIGDMIICVADGTVASDADWTVIQTNTDGAVTGPASSTDAHVAVFNGTTGRAIKDSGYTVAKSVPSDAVFTDTKNTAGSTDTSSKIFLIGATSQGANPTTYSHDTAYVGTDGCLYSNSTKVLTAHQDISGKANLASPTFTGTPKAPTATAGTNSTQIATTAFVQTAVSGIGIPKLVATDDGEGNVTITLT